MGPAGCRRTGRGGASLGSGAPPELIVGAGSAWTRPEAPAARGRGALPPYPDGVPQYERPVINEYNTVGNRIAPPFTSIVKYDLNVPAIKWRIGFGDDPALAARGITGTGAPGMLNGVIVTASGLVFGAGRDNAIRAWDTDSGAQLWSSRFGGDFIGSPVMYETLGGSTCWCPRRAHRPRSRRRNHGAARLGRVRLAAQRNNDASSTLMPTRMSLAILHFPVSLSPRRVCSPSRSWHWTASPACTIPRP